MQSQLHQRRAEASPTSLHVRGSLKSPAPFPPRSPSPAALSCTAVFPLHGEGSLVTMISWNTRHLNSSIYSAEVFFHWWSANLTVFMWVFHKLWWSKSKWTPVHFKQKSGYSREVFNGRIFYYKEHSEKVIFVVLKSLKFSKRNLMLKMLQVSKNQY